MLNVLVALAGLAVGFRAPDTVGASEASHARVEITTQEWLKPGAVAVVTHESGAVYVFARSEREALALGIGTAGTKDEVCTVSWQSGPLTVECSVTKKWGETKDEWKDRCADAVAALQTVFPPNPPESFGLRVRLDNPRWLACSWALLPEVA